jgi:hypothetical protein
MLGEVAPQEAARRLGQNSDLPPRVGDTAEHGSGGLTQADDAAARLVADVVREVDAEGSEPRQRGLPDVNFGLLGLAGMGLLLVGALGGDDSRAHVLTSALVAAGAFVFFLALGVPVGLLARRRPLAPPAAIWGALAMLAWGLLLAVTGSWHAYMPTVLFVGFVVALAVAGAGAIGIARRAEETIDLTRARANADESQKTGG